MTLLSPHEFIVGSLARAQPLSLVLPRNKYEATFLVCQAEASAVAVCLAGQHAFQHFPCSNNSHWKGLIVPDVRVEVDITSLIETGQGTPLGAALRSASRLMIAARSDQSYGPSGVTLHDDLPPAYEEAAFSRWQVIIGRGLDKRMLWSIDLNAPPPGSPQT
jgi:hypothetical protein